MKTKIYLWILAVTICFAGFIYIKKKSGKLLLSPKIKFLQEQPVIDGLLDEDLKELLTRRNFDFTFNINLFKGSAGSNYRLAYGTGFFYLYLEAKADSFICRDRGYQNGDGFILTLSNTKPETNKTDEHYVMGFSSQYEPQQLWAEKILWNYNGRVILKKLKEDVRFEYQAKEGKICFELLLPWSGVYPYHPVLSEGIGFNLWFLKAYPKRSYPNMQGVLFEIPSETGARKYVTLEFEEPELEQNSQAYVILEKNHCFQGEKIKLKAAVVSAQQLVEEFDIFIYNKNKEPVADKIFKTENLTGLSINRFDFETSELIPGNYIIEWLGVKSKSSGKLKLSVLPKFEYENISSKLESVKTKITEGSFTTMQFYIRGVNRKINNLKDYEDYPELINELTVLLDNLEQMELGNDIISYQTGIFRRAFRSELDSTLQPYKVKVPDNYDKSKKYPLLVFLHGSGKTDKDIFDVTHKYLTEGNFIQIAPNARGVSHYYGTEKAQYDINEAIQNAIENYSIDTSNIVLAGFSMGGYGVYRTFIEAPSRFKGLAIFSGEPKVGIFMRNKDGTYPNFLKKKNLKKFKDIPVFIYHGKNDLNCPYELTAKLVGEFFSSGVNVKFVSDDGAGHSSPEEKEILTKYYKWLDKLLLR